MNRKPNRSLRISVGFVEKQLWKKIENTCFGKDYLNFQIGYFSHQIE